MADDGERIGRHQRCRTSALLYCQAIEIDVWCLAADQSAISGRSRRPGSSRSILGRY